MYLVTWTGEHLPGLLWWLIVRDTCVAHIEQGRLSRYKRADMGLLASKCKHLDPGKWRVVRMKEL